MRRRDLLRGAVALLTCATPAGLLVGETTRLRRRMHGSEWRDPMSMDRWFAALDHLKKGRPRPVVAYGMVYRDGVWQVIGG